MERRELCFSQVDLNAGLTFDVYDVYEENTPIGEYDVMVYRGLREEGDWLRLVYSFSSTPAEIDNEIDMLVEKQKEQLWGE